MLKKELQEITELLPVPRTNISCLDLVRLESYFRDIKALLDEIMDGPLTGRWINRDGSPELIDPGLLDRVIPLNKYVDYRGMGIRTKVLPLMRKINQTEPEFIVTEDYLKTILYSKGAKRTV